MLVVNRFRAPEAHAQSFRLELEQAQMVLGSQQGYVAGRIGRNVDDPELWLLQTEWVGPGAYRRALSSYDVKVAAWAVLGQALDEPTAYEVVERGKPLNDAKPRSVG